MKSLLVYFLKHIAFMLLFFMLFRIAFYFSFIPLFSEAGLTDILKAIFVHNLRLDISVVCYILFIPFLLLVLSWIFKSKIFHYLNLFYFGIILLVMTVIGLANIIIYNVWGTLINSRALMYATQPKEMAASVSNFELIISIVIWLLSFFILFMVYKKYIAPSFETKIHFSVVKIISPLMVFPLLFGGARGGIQLIPINESASYFSKIPVVNHLSTNCYWYLGRNIVMSRLSDTNPYRYFPDSIAIKNVTHLFGIKNDSIISILNPSVKKTNVVIIILESWSADVIEKAGGEKNVTPNFNTLSKDGIVFSSMYSSGFRTDQGLVSLLSGFPSQPNQSVIRHSGKISRLPSLLSDFKKSGYKTSFYYGGESGFANMNSYLLSNGVERIIDKSGFPASTYSSKWGAHDEFVLQKHLEDLKQEKEPFFSVLLTLSSHEPYDIPVVTPFRGTSEPDLYRSAVYYTDSCLGKYFSEIRKLPLYENTLFILCADHGSRMPGQRGYDDPRSRKMAFMLYGNMIKNELKNTINTTLSNQSDIATTILSQLGMTSDKYVWGNDLFRLHKNNFSYISLENGFTWLTDNGYFTYSFERNEYYQPENFSKPSAQEVNTAKSYMQVLYKTFLDL